MASGEATIDTEEDPFKRKANSMDKNEPWRKVVEDVLKINQDWGDYPKPHYDEENMCMCPDHVALRYAGEAAIDTEEDPFK